VFFNLFSFSFPNQKKKQMTVYVDLHQTGWRVGRMKMCHMMADTEDELHAMADKIGVNRRHFQGWDKASCVHYDICLAKRALAVSFGAIEMDKYLRSTLYRKLRAERVQYLKDQQNGNQIPNSFKHPSGS